MKRERYKCRCQVCRTEERSQIADEQRMINQLAQMMNEKERRQFVGFLAKQHGHGGIERMVEITGLHRATISRGQKELENETLDEGRVRRHGGGRKLREKKSPT